MRARALPWLWALVATGAAHAQLQVTITPRPGHLPASDSLVASWRSTLPTPALVWIHDTGESTVAINIPGGLEVVCHLAGDSLHGVSQMDRAVRSAPMERRHQERMLAAWGDSSTLDVTWCSPVTNAPEAWETWRFGVTSAGNARALISTRVPEPKLRQVAGPVVDELPEVLRKVRPHYPTWAIEQKVEGVVFLQVLVGTDGLVKDVKVLRSIPMLDPHAIDAVRKWRFRPARMKGDPVAVWVGVPVKFSLR